MSRDEQKKIIATGLEGMFSLQAFLQFFRMCCLKVFRGKNTTHPLLSHGPSAAQG